ncbi:MFS general substrate transporter [Ascoidea rubescens DSM 1968]|uniref:MFS general substrate transporter n=1 Tax=Ascoidea rubescens DSM 1968 TaxID=1344418 RepID=A0A1D2VRI0_9ASCO|nr:MFS general substrate transporter [Ascoidea rubescens DSM 1968]ODV64177.1 MFS general substrate transporter [Ascoidea rubescens DSM 1968]
MIELNTNNTTDIATAITKLSDKDIDQNKNQNFNELKDKNEKTATIDNNFEPKFKKNPNGSINEDINEIFPHTIFTTKFKYFIIILCSMSGFWSAIAAPIYYPSLPKVQETFGISEKIANISVVVYFIFQGIAPSIIAPFADLYGRKPAILVCSLLYIGANVGIALSNNYGLMLFFRCFQATGIAPVIAICAGIVGDITTKANRGGFIGLTTGISLIGQATGALIGGLISSRFGWRAVFWFLSIGCGLTTILSFLFLPETKRTIVGNGSIPSKRLINFSPIWAMPRMKKRLTNDIETLEIDDKENVSTIKKLSSPFSIIILPEISLFLFSASIIFATWSMMLTSISNLLSSKYGYSTLKIGICFLPSGIGGLSGSIASGRLLDIYYKRCKKRYLEDEKSGNNGEKKEFDLFKARLGILWVFGLIGCVSFLIYGWTIGSKKHISIVLISTFFGSFSSISPISSSTTLLVDLFPESISSSASSINLTRCLMAAGFVAGLSSIIDKLGVGGCFTMMSGLCVIGNICFYCDVIYGQRLRSKRE